MGIKGIRTALKVDLDKHAREQPGLHVCGPSRHHKARTELTFYRTDGILTVRQVSVDSKVNSKLTSSIVPACGKIANNEVVKIECLDWTGGQIKNSDSADDVRDVDLTEIHYLSGPFDIETAEPGDVLLVEIQDVQPFQEQPWGFTGIFDRNNGGGFLDEHYPKACAQSLCFNQTVANLITYRAKAIWDFEGIFCSSRHIPHVRFAGLIHPGILGCAPSAEVLSEWNRREGELIAANTVTDRIVAQPPNVTNAHAGSAVEDIKERVAKEGARTIPVCHTLQMNQIRFNHFLIGSSRARRQL